MTACRSAGSRAEWLGHGPVIVELRPAVAVREQALDGGVGWYLSLYDDEIDERAQIFWSARGDPAARACRLELTDAVLVVRGEAIDVTRGAACTFPLYWHTDGRALHISTRLPLAGSAPFSRAGLVAAAAAAALHSSYEPNAWTETPVAGWQRLRRGALSRFADGKLLTEQPIVEPEPPALPASRDEVAARVLAAFEAYGRSQRGIRGSVLEVSGGFDSTLAAAAIRPRHRMCGVSVAFPYYEFRFESAIQAATARALGIERVEFDGTDLFPYALARQTAVFEEPSVFITAIRHSERVARFAADRGADRIYMGHGGDQCFSTHLSRREALVANPPGRGPFAHGAWRVVAAAIAATRASPWLDRGLGTFVYDARQDVWVKETFGPVIRTPFSDLAVFRAAQAWSRWCAARSERPDKTILAEALPGWLPAEILHRRGKVAYDGVWMRAYEKHGDHIAAVFERGAPMLEALGVSAQWLVRRARQLQAWQPVSDREVLALYAVSVWLLGRGIERPADVRLL